jgi:hypothetical protein
MSTLWSKTVLPTLPLSWRRFLLFGHSKVVPTEYTQVGNADFWRIRSIMMETSALAGEGGGGCAPTPFILVIITYKGALYAPSERADTLPLFHLYPYMYSVVSLLHELL